ncbi:MAG: arabinooligosaccharide transport system permease protein [Abditibacteriota bacterium]|nr:arabinooligosaccharide transport system permease protein [Abditibacteriota bacterium]
MKPNRLTVFARGVTYVTLCLMAALTLTPLLWLLAAAFKGQNELFHYVFFPPPGLLTVVNFQELWEAMPFGRYMLNSVFVASTTVVVQLFFGSLAGFALAKYEFKGKRLFMVLMLATLMIPGQVTMAPLYELIYRLGLMDSFPGLIVPQAVSVFGIFLFRQYLLQVPDELMHAARIDGCSEFRIYWDIMMPISRPMVGAFCLTSFMATWNSFLWPQIILHHSGRFTLPVALNQLVGQYQQEYGTLMAGTLLSILPVLILFLLLQREFVEGLTAGAVKG